MIVPAVTSTNLMKYGTIDHTFPARCSNGRSMNKRLILLACFLTVFVSYSIRYGYGILLPEMLPALDITKTEAGVIYTSFFIAYTVASPVLGLLGDRYNTRTLLTAFVALLGGGAFLMAFTSSVLTASVFFAMAGIGSAACWAPVMVLAQRWTTPENRGRTLAFVDTGSALGIVVTSTAIPLIVISNWRTGWMTLGGRYSQYLCHPELSRGPYDSPVISSRKTRRPAGEGNLPDDPG
jgi:MFS family permease